MMKSAGARHEKGHFTKMDSPYNLAIVIIACSEFAHENSCKKNP
jgi:hypothetical protein